MFKLNGKSIIKLLSSLFSITFIQMNSKTKNLSSTELRKKDTYVFTFPLVMTYRSMYRQVIDKKTGVGFGKWLHLGMSTPQDQDIVTPYSYAWSDVRAEPWIMTNPPIVAP